MQVAVLIIVLFAIWANARRRKGKLTPKEKKMMDIFLILSIAFIFSVLLYMINSFLHP